MDAAYSHNLANRHIVVSESIHKDPKCDKEAGSIVGGASVISEACHHDENPRTRSRNVENRPIGLSLLGAWVIGCLKKGSVDRMGVLEVIGAPIGQLEIQVTPPRKRLAGKTKFHIPYLEAGGLNV